MNPLPAILASSSSDEIRAVIRLAHRAGQSQHRLGLVSPTVTGLGHPPLLAALCLELGAELVARGDSREPCPVCAHTVAVYGAGGPWAPGRSEPTERSSAGLASSWAAGVVGAGEG